MSTGRCDELYYSWRQSAEKFDYFILALTGALCAYISQAFKPVMLGINSGTLELIALVVLITATIAGLKRVERTIQVTSLNHSLLRALETRGKFFCKSREQMIVNEDTGETYTQQQIINVIGQLNRSIPNYEKKLEIATANALSSYKLRNILILVGFSVLLCARIWSAYEKKCTCCQ